MATLLNVRNKVLKGGKHYLTSDYKTRNESRGTHNGMDLIGPNGVDDIVAIEKGTVTYTGYDASGGYWISIATNGIEHRYFKLQKNSIKVKKGENVTKGEVIARMGATGNATGNNLHFAIYKNGYVDPKPYLMNENPFNTTEEDAYTTFVRELQKSIGANVDGIAGPETLSKTPTISTSTGWNHKAVRPLQIYLQALGYNLGSKGVDGKFGKDMKACIKQYQKDIGLAPKYQDGVVTSKMYTWKHLLKLN